MSISLPHTITGGTKPVAAEVQANDTVLLNQLNRMKVFGKNSSATQKRTTVGTSTVTLSGTSETVTVDVPSVMSVNMSGTVYSENRQGKWLATFSLLLNGTPQFSCSLSQDFNLGTGNEIKAHLPFGKSAPVGLSAGSHTVAVQVILTVDRAHSVLGANPLEAGWVSWTADVRPA